MKVAIVEPVGGHGGMNYYDFGLAQGLVDAGADVTVYTCDQTTIPVGKPFEVKITFKKIWGKTNKAVRGIRFYFCLLKTLLDIKRNHIHMVHYHFFHYTIMENLCVRLARFFVSEIVVTAHDAQSFTGHSSGTTARKILARTNKIIVHNRVTKEELMKNARVPARKITIIPHGNYLSSIPAIPSRVESRKKLRLLSGHPILLFFGQIKKVKGLDLLLNAMPAILAEFPDLKLVVAGKEWKDEFSKYDRLIVKNNLQENIVLHIRYIPDKEVPLFYRSADLVILPYRKIYQSGVLLLAMSYKVPVVVADLPGMTEIIRDNHNGFLFTAGRVSSLSRRIIDALSSAQQLKQTAEEGYRTVVENHNWCTIGQQTLKAYLATRIDSK